LLPASGDFYGIGRHDGKKHGEFFMLLTPDFYFGESVMGFMISKASFQDSGPLAGNQAAEFLVLLAESFRTLLWKAGEDLLPCAVVAVGIGGINAVCAQLMKSPEHVFMLQTTDSEPC
jgi:hypothetical protein